MAGQALQSEGVDECGPRSRLAHRSPNALDTATDTSPSSPSSPSSSPPVSHPTLPCCFISSGSVSTPTRSTPHLDMASFALGGASVVSAGAVAVAGAVGHLLRPRDDGRTLPNVMASRALGGRTWNPTGGFIGSVKGGGVGGGAARSSAPVKDITEGASKETAPKAAAPKAAEPKAAEPKAAPKAAPAPEKATAPKAAANDDGATKPPSPFELFGFKPTVLPGPPGKFDPTKAV